MQRRQFVSLAPGAVVAAAAAPAFLRNAFAQEAGITGKTLTIGCSAALTGPLAGLGQDVKLGAEAALAHINSRGGINGRTLQFNIVDDAYVPQRTTDNIKQILSQGNTFALLSCVGTPNNTAILPLIEEAGVPYVAPITGASSLRKGARNVFHVRASYTDEVRRLVQRLAGMGLKSIGVVYLDNGYGREMRRGRHPLAGRAKPQALGAGRAGHRWCQPFAGAGPGGRGAPGRRAAGYRRHRFGGAGAGPQEECAGRFAGRRERDPAQRQSQETG